MAPVPPSIDIPDLALSSLELDSRSSEPFDLAHYLSSLSLKEREALAKAPDASNSFKKRSENGVPILPASDTFRVLTIRDLGPSASNSVNPAAGSVDPNNINMKGVQAAFALIGASFVLGAIWFFFWAKNGGFQWRKGDWDEYKSTVLRRKGPNGTTLSNATKSTKLGGGSVVGQGYSDEGSTISGTIPFSDMSSEAPIIKEKSNKKNKNTSKKQTAKDAKVRQVNEEKWEGGHDNDVRAYRHERVAKVGGLNRQSDAQYYGTDYTNTDRSDIGNQRSSHHSSRQHSPEKRQPRRDFSYGQDAGFSAGPSPAQSPRPPRYHSPNKPAYNARQSVPGSYNEPMDFDVQSQNTRSYHHPMPGIGKGAGGYRRDRRDSLDD